MSHQKCQKFLRQSSTIVPTHAMKAYEDRGSIAPLILNVGTT